MNHFRRLIVAGVFFTVVIFTSNIVSAAFNDTQGHLYQEAIQYVQDKGIVQGYEDGSYRPDQMINRAEFTKILIVAVSGEPPQATTDCFSDVHTDQWFAGYVCQAKVSNVISGYPDGSFGPEKNINFVEAAKILINAFTIPSTPDGEWYVGYIVSLADQKGIPGTIQKRDHLITRGEMAEMIMRLKEKITIKPSLTACDFIPSRCEPNTFSGYGDEFMENIDMRLVRETWLGWYNDARAQNGLAAYHYNNELNRTAYIWSGVANSRDEITHTREGQTVYYDYNLIKQWFADLGVKFGSISGYTFVENIGWGPYRCSSGDCTQDLIENIRSTFDFFMSEKDRSYKPHYDSIMGPYTVIGLGISLDKENRRYYLTVHYGAKLL